MSAPAPLAIRAVYTDYRRVKGRKVHQVTFEIPSELWPEAYSFLGEPTIEASDWYAIARLKLAEPAALPTKERRKLSELPLPQRAGMLCSEGGFWKYLEERHDATSIQNEVDAAAALRFICNVNTRSSIQPDTPAGEAFVRIESDYHLWLRGVAA